MAVIPASPDPSSVTLGRRHRRTIFTATTRGRGPEHRQQNETPNSPPQNHNHYNAYRILAIATELTNVDYVHRYSPDTSSHKWQSPDWFTRQTTSTFKTFTPLLGKLHQDWFIYEWDIGWGSWLCGSFGIDAISHTDSDHAWSTHENDSQGYVTRVHWLLKPQR